MEKTLVIIKPDAMKSKHVGDIISIYENNGLSIENMKMIYADKELLEKHYEEHIGKPFYNDLIEFMLSGKIIAMEIAGEDAIDKVREINGATDSKKAKVGTIRNFFGTNIQRNAVHGSATAIDANRELDIWFN